MRLRQNDQQMAFASAFSWMKIFVFELKFHWSLFLRVQLTISQHWFMEWLGSELVSIRFLNQWWPNLMNQMLHWYLTRYSDILYQSSQRVVADGLVSIWQIQTKRFLLKHFTPHIFCDNFMCALYKVQLYMLVWSHSPDQLAWWHVGNLDLPTFYPQNPTPITLIWVRFHEWNVTA